MHTHLRLSLQGLVARDAMLHLHSCQFIFCSPISFPQPSGWQKIINSQREKHLLPPKAARRFKDVSSCHLLWQTISHPLDGQLRLDTQCFLNLSVNHFQSVTCDLEDLGTLTLSCHHSLRKGTTILLFLSSGNDIFSDLPQNYESGQFFTKKQSWFDPLKATSPFLFSSSFS